MAWSPLARIVLPRTGSGILLPNRLNMMPVIGTSQRRNWRVTTKRMSQESVSPGGESRRVGIVGGGILGMTLALRLRSQGHQVTVIEAAPRIGGLVGFAFDWRVYVGSLLSRNTPVGSATFAVCWRSCSSRRACAGTRRGPASTPMADCIPCPIVWSFSASPRSH